MKTRKVYKGRNRTGRYTKRKLIKRGGATPTYSMALKTAKNNYRLAKFNEKQQKKILNREKKLAKKCNKININVDPKNLSKKKRKILEQCITHNTNKDLFNIGNKSTHNKSSGSYGFNDDNTPANSFVYYDKINPDNNMFTNKDISNYVESSF